MADQINDGGPAFPRTGTRTIDGYGHEEQDGMSLRDYLAAKAMQAMLSTDTEEWNTPDHLLPGLAERAYLAADAMLKARQA